MARSHKEYFKALRINNEKFDYLTKVAQKSHEKQASLEAEDTQGFDEYLKSYFGK